MSETAISSPVKELDPLIILLRKEFVDKSYTSLKTTGVIDDSIGATTKVGGDVSLKIDEIMDAAMNDKNIKELMPNINDAELKLIRESIRSKYGKMSYDDVSSDFIRIREDFINNVQKITDENGDEVLVKVDNGKKYVFKNFKWLYDNKITRMCVGKSTYQNVKTGSMVDKMDPKFMNMASCVLGMWALGELINHISTNPSEREFLGCKPLALAGGFCGSEFQVNNGWCVKSCSSGESNEEGGEVFPDGYVGCMNWAASKGKICEKDGNDYIIYDESTPDNVTPVSYNNGIWSEI
jgi:hypothetical protein